MSNRNVSLVRAKPWRLVTATAAAQKAILRSGVEAVRQVAVDVTGSGLTPWEITAKLDALPPLTPEPQIGSGHPCPPSSAPKKSLPASDCLPKGCPAGTLDRLLARRVEREHIRHWISAISEVKIIDYQATIYVSSEFLRARIEGLFEADLRSALQVECLEFVVFKGAMRTPSRAA